MRQLKYWKALFGDGLRGAVASLLLAGESFLFAMNGSAKITLNGIVQLAAQFHVFHGGKGMHLDIIAEEHFEYYLIFYKAKLPLDSNKKLLQPLEF